MTNRSLLGFPLIALVLPSLVACTVDTSSSDTVRTTTQNLSVGEGEYAYFRCASTDWSPSPASRLVPDGPDRLELTYTVTESYMVNDGEECIFTITDTLDSWGNWQDYYTLLVDEVAVPTSGPVVQAAHGGEFFKISYPEVGEYEVKLYLTTGRFSVQPVDTTSTGGPPPHRPNY